ncbi:MAG: adenylate/guanylate cyclase domain-containing protein [Gemmataceae bacterium]
MTPAAGLWSAWLAATRQELAAPAEALVRGSEALRATVPADAPPKFAEAVANIATRSAQLRELVARLLHDEAMLDENQEKTLRHDLRGHAAYVIGMCRLWRKQAAKSGLDRFSPDFDRLEATAGHVVTLLDKLVSFKRAAPSAEQAEGMAELLRYMDELPASQERGDLLIVDDNKFNRDYLADLLTQQGHHVVGAADGEEALRLLEAQPFDVILLDVLMPGITGFGILERLKASELWRHIPVIMVSALEEEMGVINCIARGAEDYLRRPVEPLLLRARVGACLEKKRLRDREITYLGRIDQLLHALFPPEVVVELKETSSIKPRRYERVGVMFLDVVGFTAYCDSRRDRPEEVVNSLQQHFLAFERIARGHGVQKIKTIGDAFLGTAGLLRPGDNPVTTLVRCGEEMIRSARTVSPPWEVRIGIHIGPVVAGVLGETMYSFDLWGDTVNIAARMETAGIPGTITLSGDAWREVSAQAMAELRQVAVRGKGTMEVYGFRGWKKENPV